MKVIILAGGQKSSINNESEGIPKPMIEIGGRPLLWHIMKHFSEYGLKEFIICGGYHVDMIKEYFMDFYIYESDITVNLASNTIKIHKDRTEDWKVTVVDTGLNTSAVQRVAMIEKYIDNNSFFVSYGDCLSDICITDFIELHQKSGKMATMAVTKPEGRNQLLPINEKGEICYDGVGDLTLERAWINADCFLFNKDVFKYIHDNFDLERQLLVKLSEMKELELYRHTGFWSSIETKRDLVVVEKMWNTGKASWIKERL